MKYILRYAHSISPNVLFDEVYNMRFAAKAITEASVETRQNLLCDDKGQLYEVLIVLEDDDDLPSENCIIVIAGDPRFRYYHNIHNGTPNTMLRDAFPDSAGFSPSP